ncbi:hypothetical protein PENANT_c038G01223 [Penicillium antarcticum]|uniref:SH3 domain-containing protein n=1 Tax=Penicillium antarcticum TaxID=416450 RepID=A0A1V6PU51_9EURO|nr:uncharacterized protein N7508_002140 [Penicillium antarcticum]KAJ5317632.1 hypothetical protein N7508_002140 [Penicillium antarcticum]OQD80222.1 hypothetical protein PENANT_c038G01223 [Penicillium antarcticum]
MQNMQRRFGRMTTKQSADDSQIAVLLKDFDDADMLLGKIVDSTKAWRDTWVSIATYQSRMIDEFDGLYGPIIGSSETPSNHNPVETDPVRLARTNRLRKEYDELRTDLLEELNAVEDRMTRPAAHAKESLLPMKKTIKKRNDKKADFERFQGRVDGLLKKPKRSDRDNMNLAKAETELANAKVVYQAADDDLRQRLPTLISLVFSLTPYLLEAQVEIQNRMLAHYYTVLHTYCEEEGFTSPPPPMDQIVQDWEYAYNPIQSHIESFGCLQQGKALRKASADQQNGKRPSIGDRKGSTASSLSTLSIRKGSTAPTPNLGPNSCVPEDSPSPPLSTTTHHNVTVSSSGATTPLSTGGDSFMPTPPASMPAKPMPQGVMQFAPAGPNIDYFQSSASASPRGGTPMDTATAIAAKKKRPPPPPPKRAATFVTALYDFGGQGGDDLVFREGDQIRIVQKSDSTDDWWEGELRGQKGFFPANYVE